MDEDDQMYDSPQANYYNHELDSGETLQLDPKLFTSPNDAGESSGDDSSSGSLHHDDSSSDSENDQVESFGIGRNAVQKHPIFNKIPIIFPDTINFTHHRIIESVTNSYINDKNLLIECPSESEKRLGILSGVISCMVHLSDNHNEVPTVYYAVDSAGEIIPVIKTLKGIINVSHRTELNVVVLGFTSNMSVTDYVHSHDHDVERIENFVSNLECNIAYPTGVNLSESSIRGTFVICLKEFLLSPLLRQDFHLDLESTKVIFEEGHDFEETCCQEASLIISSEELKTGSDCLKYIVDHSEINESLKSNLSDLACAIKSLSLWVNEQLVNREGVSKDEIVEYLHDNQLSHEQLTYNRYNNILNGIMAELVTQTERFENDLKIITKIRKFVTGLEFLFGENGRSNSKFYDLGVSYSEPMPNSTAIHKNSIKDAIFKMVCNSPAIVFKSFNTVSSIIVASKCLAPISVFQQDFDVHFHDTVEIEDHEVPDDRFLFKYCSKGPNGCTFSLNFKHRSKPGVMTEVGEAVLQLCQKIPYGVVVLFSSKSVLSKMLKSWKNGSIMNQMSKIKHVICELDMTSNSIKNRYIDDYRQFSNNPNPHNSENGALLFALHRGDVYKNLVFSGKEVRGIIHVGLPYGSWFNDDRVISKREYYEELFPEEGEYLNLEWYTKEMIRRVNKTFGDCARTSSDWGVNIVLDSRMIGIKEDFESLLPAWVRRGKKLKHCKEFSRLINRVERFVTDMISSES